MEVFHNTAFRHTCMASPIINTPTRAVRLLQLRNYTDTPLSIHYILKHLTMRTTNTACVYLFGLVGLSVYSSNLPGMTDPKAEVVPTSEAFWVTDNWKH